MTTGVGEECEEKGCRCPTVNGEYILDCMKLGLHSFYGQKHDADSALCLLTLGNHNPLLRS